jgi:Ca2+-binding RTX toxin-like protein
LVLFQQHLQLLPLPVGIFLPPSLVQSHDTLVGTPQRDVIAALGGNDTVQALGGDDKVCGGDGNDQLNGGTGTDDGDGGPGFNICFNLEIEANCGV